MVHGPDQDQRFLQCHVFRSKDETSSTPLFLLSPTLSDFYLFYILIHSFDSDDDVLISLNLYIFLLTNWNLTYKFFLEKLLHYKFSSNFTTSQVCRYVTRPPSRNICLLTVSGYSFLVERQKVFNFRSHRSHLLFFPLQFQPFFGLTLITPRIVGPLFKSK